MEGHRTQEKQEDTGEVEEEAKKKTEGYGTQ